MGICYGYARCSTNESKQDTQRQKRELQKMGVERHNIFEEYESGMKVDRIELKRLLDMVKDGDTIVATEVSRLTRSVKQLCELIELAKERHLKLVIGAFAADCTNGLDPMTDGMLKMMGVFAEMERNMTSQRIKSGLANAHSKGKIIGRPRLKPDDIPVKVKSTYQKYRDGWISKTDYAKICDISRPTLDKYIALMIDG